MKEQLEIESYGLEEIHKVLLKALDEFDRICRENEIHYALHGGTMLGAERNHKLIPWDDDVDVSMTRMDYQKFCEVISDSKGSSYINTEVLWVPRFVFKDEAGTVFIDIFIWDYISEKGWKKNLKLNLLRAVQGMMKKDVDYKRFGTVQKLLLMVTGCIGKLFSQKTKFCLYQLISEKWFLGKREYIHRSNDAFKDIAYIFDKDYMSEYTDIELENKQYMVNKRYHEFLIRSYGENYMTPPPAAQRAPKHQGTIKALNK